jgi:uncharacterized membrane protein
MEGNSEFEGEVRARLDRLEQTVAELAGKTACQPARASAAPSARRAQPVTQVPSLARPRESTPSRGADWWLARAGAALTLVALILLYQYAVGHGWITPVVRVLTGTAIGVALMYWGRRLEPAPVDAASPVALRELMMGAGLAAWYVSAYAAAVSYHLISIPTARVIYLLVSITGALIALNERRSLMAIIAIGTGFATPALLSSPTGSIPGFTLFLAVLGALSLYLYLMRGWQSILWIAFFSMAGSIEGAVSISGIQRGPAVSTTHFGSDQISLTLLIAAMSYAFLRAPAMRRKLVATGAERYVEPLRSLFAQNWLRDTGKIFKWLSPHAGPPDTLSVWVITLLAPLVGIALFTRTWGLGSYAGGTLAIIAAGIASKATMSSTVSDLELKDTYCVAAILWSLAGVIAIGRSFGQFPHIGEPTIPLVAVALYSIALVTFGTLPRFVTAAAVGKLLAALAIAGVAFFEISSIGARPRDAFTPTLVFSIAEVLTIVAAFAAARKVSQHGGRREVAIGLAMLGYGVFLLVDARVLGAVWPTLVTATYAIAGVALLLRSRGVQDQFMRRAGGGTIAIVILRLLFIDLVGVDTIWRVLLFLGCGALFLFTSHQIQNASRQTPPDPA